MTSEPSFDLYERQHKEYRIDVPGFQFKDEFNIEPKQRVLHTEVTTVPQELLQARPETFAGEQLAFDAGVLYSAPFVEIVQGRPKTFFINPDGTTVCSNGTEEKKELPDPPLINLNYTSDKGDTFPQPERLEVDSGVIMAKSLPVAVKK